MNTRSLLAALAVPLALAACDGAGKNVYAPPPPPEVTVASPRVEVVPETIESTGTLRGAERVDVRARVRGYIQESHVDGGERVRQGDVLFTIDPRAFEAAFERARAQVEQRGVDLQLAELEVARFDELVRKGTTTQRELDLRVATRDAALAAVELATAELRLAELELEWTTIRAPISGRVDVGPPPEVGELVGGQGQEQMVLCTIIDDSQVYATYPLDEATLQRMRRANRGAAAGQDGPPAYPVRLGTIEDAGYPHQGTFAHADNTVNPDTGTITVEALFDNAAGHLMPGLFVRVQAIVGEREVMLVPEAAVLQDQRGRFVWVVGPDDVVARADVRVGPVVDGRRVIEAGLARDARVIVSGVQRARPGAKVVARTSA